MSFLRITRPIYIKSTDPWHLLVDEVARAANFKTRRVYITLGLYISSYVNSNGSVVLTPPLLSEMTRDEVRVIVGAGIGKWQFFSIAKNAGRSFVKSWLATSPFYIGLLAIALLLKEFHVPRIYALPVQLVVVLAFYIVYTRIPRRTAKKVSQSDAVGDKFAVELTGDPEFVIATIQKRARLNSAIAAKNNVSHYGDSENYLAMRVAAIREMDVPQAREGNPVR